ncbi:hypothetical protein [Caballeronia sp. 15711]|uniref:hypothetical protein n=1 Tax=Caballeronia sp. 15711 TaxID=3391029 RepID=UPI0039E28209
MKLDGWRIPLATIAGVMGASAYFYHPADTSEGVAAWVQAVGSIGAILAAVWVAHRQYEQTRQLELERAVADAAKEQAETRAFVQSVMQELMAIWGGYEANIRPLLHATTDGGIFDNLVAVGGDIFTIYSNASTRVGKVDDEQLRGLIVLTYARAKGFVYSLQLNNSVVADLANFVFMYQGENREQVLTLKRQLLSQYAAQLKEHDRELESLLQALTARANEWLRTS